jgi:hypothetical protein
MPLIGTLPTIPHTYTFTFNSLNIINLRSQHTDTDYASFTVRVIPQGGQGIATTIVKPMGDLGTGVHPVNLSIKAQVHPTDQVVVNYFVINSGHADPNKVQTTLKNTGDQVSAVSRTFNDLLHMNTGDLAIEGAQLITSLLKDVFGSLFSSIFGDGPDCDGPVAAGQELMPYSALPASPSTPVTRSTVNPGVDSPHGCGKNSVYEVNWSVSQDSQQVGSKL